MSLSFFVLLMVKVAMLKNITSHISALMCTCNLALSALTLLMERASGSTSGL